MKHHRNSATSSNIFGTQQMYSNIIKTQQNHQASSKLSKIIKHHLNSAKSSSILKTQQNHQRSSKLSNIIKHHRNSATSSNIIETQQHHQTSSKLSNIIKHHQNSATSSNIIKYNQQKTATIHPYSRKQKTPHSFVSWRLLVFVELKRHHGSQKVTVMDPQPRC